MARTRQELLFIEEYIAQQGLTVGEYQGPPASYVSWERRQEAKRSVNRAATLKANGRGPNPKRDLFGLPKSGKRVGQ